MHPLNILSKRVIFSVLKLEISTHFNFSQLQSIWPKLVTSDVSKVDKFNDINELLSLNILLITVNLFEVMNPDKSNDISELQPKNIQLVLEHFFASKLVKFISIIESQPLNILSQVVISLVHINLTIFEGFRLKLLVTESSVFIPSIQISSGVVPPLNILCVPG